MISKKRISSTHWALGKGEKVDTWQPQHAFYQSATADQQPLPNLSGCTTTRHLWGWNPTPPAWLGFRLGIGSGATHMLLSVLKPPGDTGLAHLMKKWKKAKSLPTTLQASLQIISANTPLAKEVTGPSPTSTRQRSKILPQQKALQSHGKRKVKNQEK